MYDATSIRALLLYIFEDHVQVHDHHQPYNDDPCNCHNHGIGIHSSSYLLLLSTHWYEIVAVLLRVWWDEAYRCAHSPDFV